jgi:RNA polymerase sigma factor (sigma-70 family)
MLELLAKQHDDWIRIAYNMTDDMDAAKDLVQDTYVAIIEGNKSLEDIMYKDEINRYFVWKVIRSLFIDDFRRRNSKKYIKTVGLMEDKDDKTYDNYNLEEDDSFELVTSKIALITTRWKPYDKKLFDLYFMRGQSLRQIAKGTSIGLSSIHNSVKGYREILRRELSEDLQDYFNQDYNKII